jgi:hypothetical protein
MLQDLDNDNSPELVITQAWSRPERGACLATWRHIYKWHDGKFTDQSASFPKYYKDLRDQLVKSLAHDPDVICHQMEVDKISRLLGAPTAGFVRAEMWIQDPNGSLRRKAATVFADIGDAPSKKNLALMAKDSDPLTAQSAQMYLDSMP